MSGLDHPSVPASTSPSTMPAMPNVEVSAPAMSKWPRRRSVSCSTTRPTSRTTIPIGTLTNITQRHDTSWVSAPPATRPMAPPAADTVVKRPIARTRSRPSEKMVVSRASDGGCGERRAGPLQGPGGQEHPAGDGQPAEQRADREEGDAGQEGAAAAEEVAAAGPEQQQAAEGEQVGVEDPGQLASGEAEALLDVGQGDVDDGRVEDHHQLGGQDDEQEHRRAAEQALQASGRPRGGTVDGRGTRRDNDRRRHLIPISPLVLW